MKKSYDSISFRQLESICIYLFGLKTGQSIFEKILKENLANERQDIFAE